MVSTKLKNRKDGSSFYEIRCHTSRKGPILSMRWDPPAGKTQKTIEKELAKVAADFERRCAAGEIVSRREQKERDAAAWAEGAQSPDFRTFSENWLSVKSASLAPQSIESYRMYLEKHLFPFFGAVKIDRIDARMITAFLAEKQASGLSYATCSKIRKILASVMKTAYQSDLIERNVMDKVPELKRRKDEIVKEMPDCLKAGELAAITEALRHESLFWRTYVSVLAETGCRRGEGLALRRDCLHPDELRLDIKRSVGYTKERGLFVGSCKAKNERTVSISPELAAMIRDLLAEHEAAGISTDFLFPGNDPSRPLDRGVPNTWIKRFCKRHGLKEFHPHSLRHSFASIALTSGADPASIAAVLGHADSSVTLRVYSHASEESRSRASLLVREAVKASSQTAKGGSGR